MNSVDAKTFVARPDRRAVRMRGFALSATRDCEIELCDLSYEGCAIRCASQLEPGEILELRLLKRGVINAQIRWSGDGYAGARFLN